MKHIPLSIVCLFLISLSFASPQHSQSFNSLVSSVQLNPVGKALMPAVIQLHTNEQLQLRFDVLSDEMFDFRYDVVLCNRNWIPSRLPISHYMQTIGNLYMNSVQNSVNTHVSYVHYSAVFPHENLKLTKSGNYLLRVYDDITQELVLQIRFMVIEQVVEVQSNVRQAMDVQYRDTHHEIHTDIMFHTVSIPNPAQDLFLVYRQNGRVDNEIRGVQPSFIAMDNIRYHHHSGNLFEAGVEFHHFSTRTISTFHQNVTDIFYNGSIYEVNLQQNERGLYRSYSSRQDMNGRFLPAFERQHDTHTDADYVLVNFSLYYPDTFSADTLELYVCGGFNMWQLQEQNKMKYNHASKLFTTSILLKQGYYDYMFAATTQHTTALQTALIDGSFHQTRNEYEVIVYMYDISGNYDRIIGYRRIEQ